ncbi:MAG: ribonuclease III [Clostridia bacterium]|nr:ribonuclease III [Clostridia bacterium]
MFGSEKLNYKDFSPITLAYIGDTVYDLFVRCKILEKGERPINDIHRDAINTVSAAAQARSVHNIEEYLSEEEKGILKWGRNAKSGHVPKNADAVDYRWATGFETLTGVLYLRGDIQRLEEILNLAYLNKEDKR